MADGDGSDAKEREMAAIMAQTTLYNAGAKKLSGPGRARKGQNKTTQGRRGSFLGRMRDPSDIREQGNGRRSSLSIDRPQDVFDPGKIKECVKMGTLLVRVGPPNPRLKKWRKRHYLLTGCVLHCFADDSADRQMNEDNIETASIERTGNSSQKFSFSLRVGNQLIELAAASADAKAEWIAAFESQILLQAGGSMPAVAEEGEIVMAKNPMASAAASTPSQSGIQSAEGALRIKLADGDRLILLMTSTGAKETMEQQEGVSVLLDGLGVTHDKVDGCSDSTAKLRNNLFVVSGKWAIYPQLFVLHKAGNVTKERTALTSTNSFALTLGLVLCVLRVTIV
jgi:hypothetical protein